MDPRFFEALEHQARIARLLASQEGRSYFDTLDGYATEETGDPTPLAEMHQSLWCAILEQANPYYWAPPMCATLKQASDILPTDTPLYEHDLPGPAGFWHFAQPIHLGDFEISPMDGRGSMKVNSFTLTETSEKRPFYVRGIAWAVFSDGDGLGDRGRIDVGEGQRILGIGLWLATDDPSLGEAFGPIVMRHFGGSPASWADLAEENILALPRELDPTKLRRVVDSNLAQAKLMVAACLMLEQRLFVAAHTTVPRSSRKRMERERWQHEPVVQVIELRRRDHKPSDSMEEHQSVDWTCQWMVGAFWRSQWYPSKGIHQRILIGPFIKGPPDKPLKAPSSRLFAVVR
jgi:hypothetical protein